MKSSLRRSDTRQSDTKPSDTRQSVPWQSKQMQRQTKAVDPPLAYPIQQQPLSPTYGYPPLPLNVATSDEDYSTQQAYPAVKPGQSGRKTNWIDPPPILLPNCPPGLEYLTLVDRLLVCQKIELYEIMSGIETQNEYLVTNVMGQQVYYMKEISSHCARQCMGKNRPFDMWIQDNTGLEVMHFRRPLACDCCLCCCCRMQLEITAPPGNLIGIVKHEWAPFRPYFTIFAEDKKTPMLRIKGPLCTGPVCVSGDVQFEVQDLTGVKVGEIVRKWTGYVQEEFTDADNFGVSFPLDLDVKAKASILGCLMLIDFMFYESNKTAENMAENTDEERKRRELRQDKNFV